MLRALFGKRFSEKIANSVADGLVTKYGKSTMKTISENLKPDAIRAAQISAEASLKSAGINANAAMSAANKRAFATVSGAAIAGGIGGAYLKWGEHTLKEKEISLAKEDKRLKTMLHSHKAYESILKMAEMVIKDKC